MTNAELAVTLAPLEVTYGKPISEQHAAIYQSVLGHLPVEKLQVAVQRYLFTNEFNALPAPGLLLRYADEATNGVGLTADQAISHVRKVIRRFARGDDGWRRQVNEQLGPDIVEAVEAAGGIDRFCDCDSDGRAALVAQFREAWNSGQRRQEQARRLPAHLQPKPSAETLAIPAFKSMLAVADKTEGRK